MENLFKSQLHFIISIILMGIGCFLLGGLAVYLFFSEKVSADEKVVLRQLDEVGEIENRVYASQKGRRFYPWWCDAGMRSIKAENIVWYPNPQAAERAGYQVSKSCKS